MMTHDRISRPYIFVNFRRHIKTHVIYAVFINVINPITSNVLVYSIDDEHEDVHTDVILAETTKAPYQDCNDIIASLKSIYEVPNNVIEGVAAYIKPVPYIPFK